MSVLNKIEQLIQYKLLIPKEEFINCTRSELEHLEQLVYRNTNFVLPDTYHNFLKIGGHGIGSLLLGVGVSYGEVLSRMNAFWEDSSPLKNIDKSAFLFFYKDSHPSYYTYFLLEGSSNPLVYEYDLNSNATRNTNKTFTEYLLEGIQNSYEFRSLVPNHLRVVLFNVRKQLLSLNLFLNKANLSFWEERLKNKIIRFGERVDDLPLKAKSKMEDIIYTDFKTFIEELKTHTIKHIFETDYNLFQKAVNVIDEALKYLAYKPTHQDFNQLKNFCEQFEKEKGELKKFTFSSARSLFLFLSDRNFSEEQHLWYLIQLEYYAWQTLLT